MPNIKRVSAFLASLILVLAVSAAAQAREVPDLSKKGSISVTMRYQDKAVPGGSMTYYRVGDIQEQDGSFSFKLNASFAPSGVAVEDLSAASAAKALAKFAAEQKLPGITKGIGLDGKLSFTGLKPGLYLLVQRRAAQGYAAAEPFLVTLPMEEDGTYRYEVDASPKVELKPAAPTNPTAPSKPTVPGDKLPQTGQLHWPAAALAVLGTLLTAAGSIRTVAVRKREDR